MPGFVVDPLRKFEIAGQVSPLLAAAGSFAAGANQLLVTAISAKRIRIMGLLAQCSTTTQGILAFQSGAAGGHIIEQIYPPLSTPSQGPFLLPIVDCGYAETNTGEGLYVDVTTAGVDTTLFYITYTP